MPGHIPVLLPEVLRTLNLKPNQNVIDATLGAGGHARAMLARIAPAGRLLGIEADERTLATTRDAMRGFSARAVLIKGNFRYLRKLAQSQGFEKVQGILFDLGLSSLTIGDPERGFSFQKDGPLDMRFDPATQSLTAADLINNGSEQDLTTILRMYGEEPQAARAAAAIVAKRQSGPITRTPELAEVVSGVIRRRGPRHPATKIFQALRIAVNDELGALREALPQALDLLDSGGRLAIISFHSLEDRIVKNYFRQTEIKKIGQLVNKKVIKPSRAEQLSNPRSRSAVMRVWQKNPD